MDLPWGGHCSASSWPWRRRAGEGKEWEAVTDAVNEQFVAMTCDFKAYGIETISLGSPG